MKNIKKEANLKMKNEIKYTIYLPPEVSQQIEFIRFKTRHKKNDIVLEALADTISIIKEDVNPELKIIGCLGLH